MANQLLDSIKNQVLSGVLTQVSSHLGESESSVSKAISGLLPVVLGGVAQQKDNTTFNLFDGAKQVAQSGILSNLNLDAVKSPLISGLISSIFGNKIGSIVSGISSFSGVKESSANSLLSLASTAVLGTLGKHAISNNLSQSSFNSFIGEQTKGLSGLIPAGLNLGSLGLGNLFSDTKTSATYTENKTSGTCQKGGWWKWLLALLLLALLAFLFLKKCNSADKVVTTPVVDSLTVEKVVDTIKTVGGKVAKTIDLNGLQLNAFEGGIEDQLVTFIGSDDYKNATPEVLKEKWFNFDNVTFEMGSADKITTESQVQLENLANILKANPTVKVKIGGYTDKKGDDASNLALSQKRADFIKSELTKLGVGKQVTGAEGYGEKFATVDENATDDERAIDRKMSLRLEK